MRLLIGQTLLPVVFLFASVCAIVAPAAQAGDGQFAVRAGGFLDAGGTLVKDATLLVEDGKIAAIGQDVTLPDGCVVLERSDAVLCPGFIDVHVVLGTMQNTGEAAHAIESEADAADLFNRFHHDFERAARAGITTVVIAPASSHLVGGSTAVVKTAGKDPQGRILGPGPLKLSLTSAAFTLNRPPTSLQGGLDDLRRMIAAARENRKDDSAFARWARGEAAAMVDVADTDGSLLGALARFADREKLDCFALHANFAAERLDDAKSLRGPMVLGTYEFHDPLRFTRTPAILRENKIAIALTSNAPQYAPELLRVGAAIAMRQGLSRADAFRALTETPAKIAGVSDRVGTLAVGQDADFIVFSDHPLDLTSRIREVFVDGERVYRLREPRPTDREDDE